MSLLYTASLPFFLVAHEYGGYLIGVGLDEGTSSNRWTMIAPVITLGGFFLEHYVEPTKSVYSVMEPIVSLVGLGLLGVFHYKMHKLVKNKTLAKLIPFGIFGPLIVSKALGHESALKDTYDAAVVHCKSDGFILWHLFFTITFTAGWYTLVTLPREEETKKEV